MALEPLKKSIKERKHTKTATPSFVLEDGKVIGEMVYDGKETKFAVYCNGEWQYVRQFTSKHGEEFFPYSAKNNLIINRVVILPSEVRQYQNEGELLGNIQSFIHRYVDVSPLFERLSAYYVLFSWIHDDFNELPYLRVLGDAGSGKTRFLLTLGSLCYKTIFACGASTVSPLFRTIDAFSGGMLAIDEGDFPQSDEKAEIVKILNNGNAKGFPVLRSETTTGKEYNPRAYQVFSPKIIATRSLFLDKALESRCLTEEMGHRRLREDVPINLPAVFWTEAEQLRNQLLYFRFQNLGKHTVLPELVDRTIEPRINQVFVPLLSIISDEQTLKDLKQVAHEYNRQLLSDKGMDSEGQLLEVIAERRGLDDVVSIKEITHHFIERFGNEYEYKITPKWIGGLIRKKLHLRTERRKEGYVVSGSEGAKIKRLLERYGLKPDETTIAPDERREEVKDAHDELGELPSRDSMTPPPMESLADS